jgi:predicted O-linked N-acetylglucosamine transferase (SPINDLY family)
MTVVKTDLEQIFDEIDISIKAEIYSTSINLLQKIFKVEPNNLRALIKMGSVLNCLGRYQLAHNYFLEAKDIAPKDESIYLELGNTQLNLQNKDKALTYYLQALNLNPLNINCHLNLGFLCLKFYERENYQQECMKYFYQAYDLDPTNSLANFGLGYAGYVFNNLESSYILKYMPNVTGLPSAQQLKAYNLLANAYISQKEYHQAQLMLDKIKANGLRFDADAYFNLSIIKLQLNSVSEAIKYVKKAININKKVKQYYVNLITYLHYAPNVDHHEMIEVAQKFYENCVKNIEEKKTTAQLFNSTRLDPDKLTLKIGFVSADFKQHALYFFVHGLFEKLKNMGFHVTAYMNNLEDSFSHNIKKEFNVWRNIYTNSDQEFIKIVKEDEIDVLFDLSGHTAGTKLMCFTQRLAPLQISWLGQAGPFGIPQVDYILTDKIMVPEAEASDYLEKHYFMPNHFTIYNAKAYKGIKRSSAYEKNGYVTLGVVNNAIKINQSTLDTWLQILKQSPASTKLMIKNASMKFDEQRFKFLQFFQDNGINLERIILESASTKDKFLINFNEIDLALDTFPLGGGTTTHETLLMGTPLITLKGKIFSHRTGASILHYIGHDELVATSQNDYINKAVELIKNPDRLVEYKKTLHEDYLNSSVVDLERFTGDFARAILDMWRQTCAASCE